MSNKVTIYTLAEELNVSPSTVSRAFNPNSRLNEEKRARILALAKERGFLPNRAAARLPSREIHIGAVIINHIPDFYQDVYDGIVSAAQELASQKVVADIRMISNSDNIIECLFSALDDFRERHYDGIILDGVYNLDIIVKINEFVDAGIPVATLHNDLVNSRRLFNSTCNAALTGKLAAELLRMLIHGERKNVVIFTGDMSSFIHQQIFLSFTSACFIEKLHLVQNYDTMDVPAFAERLVREAFQAHPQIDGIYVSSANSIPVCEYLVQNGLAGKVTLVTSDTFPRLNEYIRSGVVSASIYQDPFHQGKNAFVHLYNYIAENIVPPPIIRSNPQIITPCMLELFEKQP